MKITILYPADYFDIRKVDADYRQEYEEAVKFPEFQAVLYNYDNFVANLSGCIRRRRQVTTSDASTGAGCCSRKCMQGCLRR